MKKFIIGALIIVMGLQACHKNGGVERFDEKRADKALLEKYPDAVNIAWRLKNSYSIADFKVTETKALVGGTHSAWFNMSCKWLMTETDIVFDQLPTSVQDAFKLTEYASWKIDDIDKIEREGVETVYVIEVEQNNVDVDLYYSADGVLLKEVKDVEDNYDYEDYIPDTMNTSIESFIAQKYPNARIIEIDRERNGIEVDILDERVKRELLFDLNNKWLYTKTEVRLSEVPEAVLNVLNDSEYGTYRRDDIDHYLTENKEYYIFELENRGKEIDIMIDVEGNLSVVQGKDKGNNDSTVGDKSVIKDFIAKNYPNARIVDIDTERTNIEVEIIDGNIVREVVFDKSNNWLYTKTEVRLSSVPEIVLNALKNSEYASYMIDSVEHYLSVEREYYIFDLEKGEIDVDVEIDIQGNINVLKIEK